MRWPGEPGRPDGGGDPWREIDGRSRRNLILIVAIAVAVIGLQQAGLFSEPPKTAAVTEVDLAAVERTIDERALQPASGATDPAVRIVEFFDYRSNGSRRMAPILAQLLEIDPEIRIVWIDLPQLGPESERAARFALAAALQGRYDVYRRALMFSTVPLDEEGLAGLGEGLGLDPRQLAADANSAPVTARIDANRTLAETAGVDTTPGFLIGDILVTGAMDLGTLRQLVEQSRKGR